MKIEHPIPMKDNEYVEVWWLGHWNKCRYVSWEPITEDHYTEPKEGSEYRIIYYVNPLHIVTGDECHPWQQVHHTRVRPIKDGA